MLGLDKVAAELRISVESRGHGSIVVGVHEEATGVQGGVDLRGKGRPDHQIVPLVHLGFLGLRSHHTI